MAYYEVTFEGKKYISREMYMRVFEVGQAGIMLHQRGKVILDTLVFGPLTDREKEICKPYSAVAQDFDAQTAAFVKADGTEQTIQVSIKEDKIFKYRNRRYARLVDIKDDRRYRLQSKLAVVKVCGRGIYVCLDARHKDVANPVVIVEKK